MRFGADEPNGSRAIDRTDPMEGGVTGHSTAYDQVIVVWHDFLRRILSSGFRGSLDLGPVLRRTARCVSLAAATQLEAVGLEALVMPQSPFFAIALGSAPSSQILVLVAISDSKDMCNSF
jgi:hypothetical protein